jgi:NADPH:quinone reductase-like Zn-dependent oxidoreductase
MMAAIARSSSEPIQVCSIPRPIAQAAAHARHPVPAILGLDLAGMVEAVGSGVKRLRPGDEVYGMTSGVGGHPGTLAQFAAVDADLLALKPRNLSLRESAALPPVFITAWEGLVDRAAVRAEQTVLIHGGTGGIGHIAVQLANSVGATVFATGSAGQSEQIEGLSATLDLSFKAVRRFGHVVSALGWTTHALAPLSFRAATYSGIFTLLPLLTNQGRAHHGEILEAATRLAETGEIRPHLDPRRFTLESVGEDYAALTNRTARGKLVVDVGDAA